MCWATATVGAATTGHFGQSYPWKFRPLRKTGPPCVPPRSVRPPDGVQSSLYRPTGGFAVGLSCRAPASVETGLDVAAGTAAGALAD